MYTILRLYQLVPNVTYLVVTESESGINDRTMSLSLSSVGSKVGSASGVVGLAFSARR
jgi:hypothetical protein